MTKEMSQLSIKRIGIPCSYGEDTQNWHTNTARNWERKTYTNIVYLLRLVP